PWSLSISSLSSRRSSDLTVVPALSFGLRRHPAVLFCLALARWAFLPLYLLCNLHGDGAAVPSVLFYLLVVQFPFGLTNGWLGSTDRKSTRLNSSHVKTSY